jgi:hypothetical protein
MSIKHVVSNHPHFEYAVRTARTFLASVDMSQNIGKPLEDVLVRELLAVIDSSPVTMHAINMQRYLEGEFDYKGQIAKRGTEGVIRHLLDIVAGRNVVAAPHHGMGQLNNMYQIFNSPMPSAITLFNAAAHLITRTATAAGIMLTPGQVAQYANHIRGTGATTDEEFSAAFDNIMRHERPHPFLNPMIEMVEFNRVRQEVSRLLEIASAYRMPFQIDTYASEITYIHGPNLSERDISPILDSILLRELQGRGVFVIDQHPTLTGEESIVAKSLRASLARQGESWTMKDIDKAAIALYQEVKEAGVTLTTEMVSDYIAHQIVSSAAMKARSITTALKEAGVEKSTRNIGDTEIYVKSDLKIAAEEMLDPCNGKSAVQLEQAIGYRMDDHYRFNRNDWQYVMAREYGVSPTGNVFMGAWVIREYLTGEYIDHDRNRHDLAERHAIKLES